MNVIIYYIHMCINAREEKAEEPDGLFAARVQMQLFSALKLPTTFSVGVCVCVGV